MQEVPKASAKQDPAKDEKLAGFCFFPGGEAGEGPILSAALRSVVHQWLMELGWADDLRAVGLEPRRRAFFDGPPGCGKTTLAQHIAARLGLKLAVIDLQAISSSFIHGTSRNVGTLFSVLAPYEEKLVVLLDEFDALGTKRSDLGGSNGDRERNETVIAFLQRFDRFNGLLIAASNRGKDIDPALWRRFDMHLTVDLPDEDARWAIITRYLAPFQAEQGLVDVLCEATQGATPAILRQLCENVKRDLVLAPRFKMAAGAADVMQRAVMSIQPSSELPQPSLWEELDHWSAKVAQLPWPPVMKKAEAA